MDPRTVSLLAPLVFVLPGLAIAFGLGTGPERAITPRLGLSYLLGVAAVGQLAFLLGLWTGVPLRRGTFVAACLGLCLTALGGARAARLSGPPGPPGPPGPLGPRASHRIRLTLPHPAAVALTLLGALIFATVLADARAPIHDWDGRMTWVPKARYMAAGESVLPAPLTERAVWVIHPRYPPLLPIAQVALTRLVQSLGKEWLVRGLYAAFYPALLLALYGALREESGRSAATIATALVATLPMLAWSGEGGVASTYSDIPLAAFLGLGALLLARASNLRQGFAAGLCLGAALLTKNEGVVLALATVGGGAVALLVAPETDRTPGKRKAWLAAACWVAVAGASLLTWRSQIPNRNDEGYFESFSLGAALEKLQERLPAIGNAIGDEMTNVAHWGWFWPLAAACCLLGFRWSFSRRTIVYWAPILASVVMVLLAYASTIDLETILHVTAYRFLAQVVVPVVTLIAVSIGGLAGEAGP